MQYTVLHLPSRSLQVVNNVYLSYDDRISSLCPLSVQLCPTIHQNVKRQNSVVQITAEKICGSSANYTFLPGPGQDQAGWLRWCGGVLIINCIPAVALSTQGSTGPAPGQGASRLQIIIRALDSLSEKQGYT